MKKILLTTVFRPFGVEDKYNKKGDEFLLDYLASRLTCEPGLFSLSSYVPHSGLHLIASNLPLDARVMEYPTVEEFIAEVKNGYDFIGINFLIKGFRKVYRMISLAKKISPKTKIIIGGFGTSLHNIQDLGADYVCKGEGVSFMKELLGIPDDPIKTHPVITAEVTLKIFQGHDFIHKPRMGLITSGFGCPNACEFCCTSAYYEHKNIPFINTGNEIYDVMRFMKENTTQEIDHFLIYEEDFMLYEDKVKSLGKCIQEDEENLFTFGCFASIKSISNYDIEELVSMGMGHVWIGIESVQAPFEKRQGRDIGDVFNELHSLGVTTTGSSVFGLDHHESGNLQNELDFILALKPNTVQLSNLMPGDGTPLRKRLEEEKRITKLGFKDADLYSEVIDHPAFKRGQLTDFIFKGYDEIYNALGPSIYRIYETWFTGYKNLKKSNNKLLNRRADKLAKKIKSLTPVFLYTSPFLPNDEIRSKVKETLREVELELEAPESKDKDRGTLIKKIFELEEMKIKYVKKTPIEPSTMTANYRNGLIKQNIKTAYAGV